MDVGLKKIVSDKTEYSTEAPVGAALVAQAMDRRNGAGRYQAMQSIKDWDSSRLAYRTVKRAFDIVFSMYKDADERLAELKEQNEIAGAMFKMKDDPRVTKIGRFIRKHSIDEFPQFLNVFLGQMSVVGPRPPLPNEVALYTEYDLQRLAVKPGITGWWQVTDRNDTDLDGMVRRDLEYIAKRGLLFDLKIVVLTVFEVFSGEGAS